LIRRHEEEARVLGVPRAAVLRAAAATQRAFARERGNSAGLALRTRSYFWKAARGASLRSREASLAVSRLILSSVVEDLSLSGRDALSVWDELERGWSDRVPAEVLEEYRVRLCA
jgi:hypothetical protein